MQGKVLRLAVTPCIMRVEGITSECVNMAHVYIAKCSHFSHLTTNPCSRFVATLLHRDCRGYMQLMSATFVSAIGPATSTMLQTSWLISSNGMDIGKSAFHVLIFAWILFASTRAITQVLSCVATSSTDMQKSIKAAYADMVRTLGVGRIGTPFRGARNRLPSLPRCTTRRSNYMMKS